MSRGKHRSGAVSASHGPGIAVFGAFGLSEAIGIALGAVSLAELLRYQPYDDAGAGTAGLYLGIAAVILAGGPVLIVSFMILRALLRRYSAWKQTLTPGERTAVTFAELGALIGLHEALKHHNREVSARLTESVMGPKQGA